MKKLILIFAILLPVFCSSQNVKGSLFLETGATLFGGGDYMPFVGKTGVSFWQSKTFVERDNEVELFHYNNYNVKSFSIAPRLGYYLNNKTAIGVDFQFNKNNNFRGAYDDKENYWNLLSGIFLRYYFLNKKNTPFIEFASGTGISKNIEKSISPGGAHYEKIKYFNLPYISGSVGYSFNLSPRFKLGIAATVQNTFEKPNDKGNVSTDIARISILETGLITSISYNFKINKKE